MKKVNFEKRLSAILERIPDSEIVETFRIEAINPSRIDRFVNHCSKPERWIIENWARFFRDKKIPYVVAKSLKNGDYVWSLWKECRNYTEKELSEEGWRIASVAGK